MMDLKTKANWHKLFTSAFLRDSLWSVVGNGMGNFLLLVGGVIIARFLGKDLYGEYGMVKSTMFFIGGFASFGLEYTATKFIAESRSLNSSNITGYIKASMLLTIVFSFALWLLLLCFSERLALFLDEPRLSSPFRYLGAIIFFRAICTTTKGLLGGFNEFKSIGFNSVLSGIIFILLGPLLTSQWGLVGSFIALLITQVVNAFLNCLNLYKIYQKYPKTKKNLILSLFRFSIPVAIQELVYSVCNWGIILVLTKYASLGEVGIYTAASQWYAVSLFIPNLLVNVVLSYLAGNSKNPHKYKSMLNKMILINFICAFIPFVIISSFSSVIASFYGADFEGLQSVLIVLLLATIFACISSVYQSDFLARNKNWQLLILRTFRDGTVLLSLYLLLNNDNNNAAFKLAVITTTVWFTYCVVMIISNRTTRKAIA